ncbi:MAG: hypothetical protein M0018_03630, partial [Nitrospiraceae bacterium]|nr:hypothetical protein [Nitrospiraceae bacterium]
MRRTIAFFCLALVLTAALTGCQVKPEQLRPALANEGEVYVYMEPFPRGAERLSFDLGGIYAVDADGVSIPLELRTARFTARRAGRQRLAAGGLLPPRRYAGLALKVK